MEMEENQTSLGFFRRFLNRFLCQGKKKEEDVYLPSDVDCEIECEDKVENHNSEVLTSMQCENISETCEEPHRSSGGGDAPEKKAEKSTSLTEPPKEEIISKSDGKEIENGGTSEITNGVFPSNEKYREGRYGAEREDVSGVPDGAEVLDGIADHVKYENGSLPADVKLLEESLSTLECPFTWKPDKDGAVFRDGQWISDDIERSGIALIEYLTAREDEFRLVKHNFFRKLCVHLVLAYEKSLLGKLSSAASDIYQCQTFVNEAWSVDSSSSKDLRVTSDRKEGIYYVLMATIAHISFLKKIYNSALSTVISLQEKSSNFSQEAMAVVHGLHTGVLMEYGYRGNRMAIYPVRAAIKLDPDCWLWLLFLGKLLGRARRKSAFTMAPDTEEFLALRRAAELQPEAQCLSHLADLYKHLYTFITRMDYMPDGIDKIIPEKDQEELPRMAKELYIKAATQEPNCPYNNARCAKGLLSLPIPFKDMELAEQYIVRALHLAPNDSLVNHYAAIYYETRREFDQALASYRKALSTSGGSFSGVTAGAGNFPAELGYLALQHRLEVGQQEWTGASTQVGGGGIRGGRYSIVRGAGGIGCASRSSPLFQLDAMFSKYKSKSNRVMTLCNKGYYLLKYEKDINGAFQTFEEAIRTDPKSVILKNFWSTFNSHNIMRSFSPINVYNLMEEEIKNALQKPCSSDNHDYLESLLKLVNEHGCQQQSN